MTEGVAACHNTYMGIDNAEKVKKIKVWIFSVALIVVTAVMIFLTWLCSENFAQIMNMPQMDGTHIDIGAEDNEYVSLYGHNEFFYNKWIVTDGLEAAEPDAVVEVPKAWTGWELNGSKLDRFGYASYRWTMTVEPGVPFIIYTKNFIGAYRVFVNGQLCTEYGSMSKDPTETASDGVCSSATPYIAEEGELLTVVVELSASETGGLTSSMCYVRGERAIANALRYGDTLACVILGALLMLILINLVINAGQEKEGRDWTLTVFLSALALMYFFSLDLYWKISETDNIMIYNCIAEVFYAFAVLLGVAFIVHLVRTNVIKFGRKNLPVLIGSGIVNLACIGAYYGLIGYNERIIPVFVQIGVFTLLYFPLLRASFDRVKFAALYTVIFFGIIFAMGITFMDMLNFVIIGTESVTTYAIVFIMIAVYAIYLLRIREQNLAALRAEEYRRRITEIKSAILREQIKPHFVFNCLASIQQIYHENLQEGDRALESFSRHLRANIDADEKVVIPFAQELENILNYVKLEQMRVAKEINLMLDVEFWDFEIPALALQPFVENAIKHSGILDDEDGYVLIATEFADGKVVITVEDNGCGFDVDAVGEKSVGLRNSRERLSLMTGAETEIVSRIGEGTRITISFEMEEGADSGAKNGSEAEHEDD